MKNKLLDWLNLRREYRRELSYLALIGWVVPETGLPEAIKNELIKRVPDLQSLYMDGTVSTYENGFTSLREVFSRDL